MKFWEIYRVLRKRKWMLLFLVLVSGLSVFVATMGNKKQYVATSQILPSDAALYRPLLPDNRTDGQGGRPDSAASRGGQLPNLMSLITSRTVAERTVQSLGIRVSPDAFRSQILVDTAPNPAAVSRVDRGTDVVRISVVDVDPGLAVRAANTVASVFQLYYQEISHQEASSNRHFLETQLEASVRKLDVAADDLARFKSANGITSLPEETSAAVSQLTQAKAQRDAALAMYAETQAKLNRVEQQIRTVSPTRVTVEGTTNTAMVKQLETQVATLTGQMNEAKAKYSDEHPAVITLRQALNESQRQLRVEKGKVNLNSNVAPNPAYEALLQQRVSLQSERDGYSARVSELASAVGRTAAVLKPGTDVRLARLQQEFTDAQASYSSIKTQMDQARLNERETTQTGAIRIVDNAVGVDEVGRGKLLYIVLAMVLSLVVGVALSLAVDALDNRIRTDADLEGLLALPVTGLVPKMLGQSSPALSKVTYLDPLSPASEAYKFLRTDLLLTNSDEPTNVIMVATAKPGQGGTTTAANLAISLALDGKRVVLVDADMRRPQLHTVFKIANEVGLSNVLSGEKDLDEVLTATEIPNLFLMPAGPTPINPSELLGSSRMVKIIDALRESADFVLFDTPSAVAFTDSVVLSRVMDGVLLVVRANQVARGAELQVKSLLNKARARIIGVVLNDVDPEGVDSAYYHSHYYPNVRPSASLALGYSPAKMPELEQGVQTDSTKS